MISNDRETELELIRLAQAGDQRAFRQLIQEAHSRMWAVCLSTTGNRHDAEDALQNALTSIWRNIGKFEPRAKFSTWAYRIASNAALHVIRSRRDTLDALRQAEEQSAQLFACRRPSYREHRHPQSPPNPQPGIQRGHYPAGIRWNELSGNRRTPTGGGADGEEPPESGPHPAAGSPRRSRGESGVGRR